MNILSNTEGHFVFLDKEDNKVEFKNWNDIPDNFEFNHVIKFMPNIPPPPHTTQQHLEIEEWNQRLKTFIEIENNASSN